MITDDEIVKFKEQFQELAMKINSLLAKKSEADALFTVMDACSLLKVSKRTLQKYRDEGRISFSQVGDKIFFTQSDIDSFLGAYHVEAFAQKGGKYVN